MNDELSDLGSLGESVVEDRYPPYLTRKMPSTGVMRKNDLRWNASARAPKRHQRMSQLVLISSVLAAVTVFFIALGGQTKPLTTVKNASTDVTENAAGELSAVHGQMTSQSTKEGLPGAINIGAQSGGKVYYERVPAEPEPPLTDEQSNSNDNIGIPLAFGHDVAVAMLPSDGDIASLEQMSTGDRESEVRSIPGPETYEGEATARRNRARIEAAPERVRREPEKISVAVTNEDVNDAGPVEKRTKVASTVRDFNAPHLVSPGVVISDDSMKMTNAYTKTGYHALIREYTTRQMAEEAHRVMTSRHYSTMKDVPWQIEPRKARNGTIYMLILGPMPTWNEASKLCVRLLLLGESDCSVKA